MLTAALIDRLVHKVYILGFLGPGFRTRKPCWRAILLRQNKLI